MSEPRDTADYGRGDTPERVSLMGRFLDVYDRPFEWLYGDRSWSWHWGEPTPLPYFWPRLAAGFLWWALTCVPFAFGVAGLALVDRWRGVR